MLYSQFVAHFVANRLAMPHGVAERIRRAAVDRLQERQRSGRADSPLLFTDLIDQIETAIHGA